MIILSNIWIGLPRLKKHVKNMAEKFHCDYITACVPHMKPHPKYFQQSMYLMGSNPVNTVVVGDRTKKDILGGNKLGLYTILVNPLSPESIRTASKRAEERKIMDHLGLPHRL